ncbi:MAG: peptidase [Sphingobium sp.]|nr:peptidase [Sphingobium sp.]
MLRLAWALARRAWPAVASLPRKAAAALTPVDPSQPYSDGRLWRAMLIVSGIALFVWWALPQIIWVRSPSIDARAVRLAPGPIGRDDLVMFTLRHRLAGPDPVSVTKYALCLPGDLLTAYRMRSERYPAREEAAFFCNGALLGVSKPYGHDGQRLDFFPWRSGRIPAGKAYIGSSYKDGFDSRYFGLVPLSALTRMERVL